MITYDSPSGPYKLAPVGHLMDKCIVLICKTSSKHEQWVKDLLTLAVHRQKQSQFYRFQHRQNEYTVEPGCCKHTPKACLRHQETREVFYTARQQCSFSGKGGIQKRGDAGDVREVGLTEASFARSYSPCWAPKPDMEVLKSALVK